MTRGRWLVLAGCAALLRLVPACSNTCGNLNPQPEPPGGGCNEADTRGTGGARADAGTSAPRDASVTADANATADASVDRAAGDDAGDGSNPDEAASDQGEDRIDVGADEGDDVASPEAGPDGDGATSGDAEPDGEVAADTTSGDDVSAARAR